MSDAAGNARLQVRRRARRLLAAAAAGAVALGAAGCAPRGKESPTSGRLAVLAAEPLAALAREQAALFNSLYPQAQVAAAPASTREALVALLQDSVRCVMTDRPLNEEERAAARGAGLEIEELKVAVDALALVARRPDGVAQLPWSEAEAVLGGERADWAHVAGSGRSGPVTLVTTGPNSGAYDLLARRLRPSGGRLEPARVAASELDVLAQVAETPGALGVVSLSFLKSAAARPFAADTTGRVRTVDLAVADSTGTVTVRRLHAANVYRELWPLSHPVYLCFQKRSLLAAGFAAFVASAPGQKLIVNAGIVPATMPVRLVQLRQEGKP